MRCITRMGKAQLGTVGEERVDSEAIGTNLKRASRFLESEAKQEHSAG